MKQLESIQTVVRELSRRELSAAEASLIFRRSSSRFRHRFTAVVGVNFRTARMRAKLDRGAHLLIGTRLSIAEISARLGYSDRSKFEKAFKRVRGMTPTEFRRRHGDR